MFISLLLNPLPLYLFFFVIDFNIARNDSALDWWYFESNYKFIIKVQNLWIYEHLGTLQRQTKRQTLTINVCYTYTVLRSDVDKLFLSIV